MPKISVIVPTFKTAKYLPKCLDSILNQTFQDFEIIIVSDGPNEDHKIADEYAKKDNRITVLKDIKKDLGGARNAGIKIAKGKYFCSIDSDDWIEPTYLEKMYRAITSAEDVDIVQCGTEIVFEGAVDKNLWKNDEAYFAIRNDGIIDCDDLIFGTINVGTWNKLYKKELVDKYNIQFPENLRNEDAYFTWAYWMVSRKMYCIKEHLYNYLRRDDSLMAQTFKKGLGDKVLDHLKVGSLLYDFLIKNDLFEKRKYAFWRAFVICWCFARDNGDEDVVKKAKKYVKKFFKGGVEPKVEPELMNIIAPNKMKFKKIISNIFSITNSVNKRHKIIKLFGFKIKVLNKKYDDRNKVIIVENGKERILKRKEKIKGLNIRFKGRNNVMKIFIPSVFEGAEIEMLSEGGYIEINKTPRFMWHIKMENGHNQKFIFGEGSDTSYFGEVHLLDSNAQVIVGKDCMFAGQIIIFASDAHTIFDINSKKALNKVDSSVTIGDHVWVAQGAKLLKNAQVPSNSIVANSAIVTKKFDEENIILAGNPAHVVKTNVNWDRCGVEMYENEIING